MIDEAVGMNINIPKRKVFLIGGNHEFQMVSRFTAVSEEQFEKFRTMLRDLIKQHGIRGIGEEMNIEALHKWGSGPSIACELAKELGIAHRYCDADTATRNKEGYPGKERYWLEQLEVLDGFPALFIMGADHVDNFNNLLRESGFETQVVVRDLESIGFMGADEKLRRFFQN
jgi:hypothetical protein